MKQRDLSPEEIFFHRTQAVGRFLIESREFGEFVGDDAVAMNLGRVVVVMGKTRQAPTS